MLFIEKSFLRPFHSKTLTTYSNLTSLSPNQANLGFSIRRTQKWIPGNESSSGCNFWAEELNDCKYKDKMILMSPFKSHAIEDIIKLFYNQCF